MPRYGTIRVPVEHPLASRNASYNPGSGTVQIWKHRYVLFDKIGYGPHRCHWCGRNVNWRPGKRGGGGPVLVCDHLDGNVRNNDPENLVAACTGCNVHRNHPFAAVRDDEPFIVKQGKRHRATVRVCEQCGAEFLIMTSSLETAARKGNVVGRFCNRTCMWAPRQRQHD